MNDQSLDRANAFLAAVAARVAVGEVLTETPAEIGRDLDLPDPLSTARAVRALIARRRLEPAGGSYRLLDTRPLDPGERESVGRRPRRKAVPREAPSAAAGEAAAYSDLGRAVADKLIELGRENAELRAEVRQLREETRDAKAARDDAERRARSIGERSRELEHRAEMAEANLRSLLAAARTAQGSPGKGPDTPVGDAEMEAILGVLRGGNGDDGAVADGQPPASDGQPSAPGGASAAGDATEAG
jgi:hypothetical protein